MEHDRWLSDKFVQLNKSKIYAQATIEYNSIVTIAKFKQLVQSIPADILRYNNHLIFNYLFIKLFCSCVLLEFLIIQKILDFKPLQMLNKSKYLLTFLIYNFNC